MVRIAGRDIEVYQRPVKTPTNVGGLVGLVLGGAVPGVLAGFLVDLVSGWIGFYVQIISPVVIGLVAGFGLLIGTVFGEVGRNWTWFLAGAVSGSLGYLSLLFFLAYGLDSSNPLGMLVLISGAWERIWLGFNVPLWSWWVFEAGIAIAVSCLLGCVGYSEAATGKLSCHDCKRAFRTRTLFTIPVARAEDAIHAISDDDCQRIKDLQVDYRDGDLKVVIDYCSDLSHPAYLTIRDKVPSTNPELVRLAAISNEGAAILLDYTSPETRGRSAASDGTGPTTAV